MSIKLSSYMEVLFPTKGLIDIHINEGEIEKFVQEMLDISVIQPSRSSFLASVVMVRRKDNAWRMFPNYKDLNKITIKNKFLFQILMSIR